MWNLRWRWLTALAIVQLVVAIDILNGPSPNGLQSGSAGPSSLRSAIGASRPGRGAVAAVPVVEPLPVANPVVQAAVQGAVTSIQQEFVRFFGSGLAHGIHPVARNISLVALVTEEATKQLAASQSWSKSDIIKTTNLPLAGTALSEICPTEEAFSCQPSKYRSPSSYCNNVQNPRWGNAYTGYGRLLLADYADGLMAPRLAILGNSLPSAKLVSDVVHGASKTAPGYLTVMAAVWAQYVSHDLSYPVSFSEIGGVKNCCQPDANITDCMPIPNINQCLHYSRTAPAPRRRCTLGPREQMNAATAFLDASATYGNSDESSMDLRLFDGGFLKTSAGDLLPATPDGVDCIFKEKNCVRAGDIRANDNPALTTLHTLFLREHNRLAQELADVNPLWDDETLYQESRRIVAAIVQHITYKEFLPSILGENLAQNLKLKPLVSGYTQDYDIDTYPGTFGSAAVSALQFYLGMFPDNFDIYNMKGEKMGQMSPSTKDLKLEEIEELMLGIVSSVGQRVGLYVVPSVRNAHARDNVANLIQQGRDHGLPSYTAWRQFCGLKPVSNFSGLGDILSSASIDILSRVYKNVSDVDLFTGGLAETPLKGAIVGPTFGCILAHQFSILRKADRFWYENDVPPSSFSKQQLQELRKVSLAGLVCQNFENIHSVPPQVFHEKDAFLNSPIPCDLMPQMDLSHWASDVPAIQVPDDLLKQSIDIGITNIIKRREEELALFTNNLGADPKSPIGTAFGFSRPTHAAILMSNTSLMLEYASQEFLNSIDKPQFSRIKRQLGFQSWRQDQTGLRNKRQLGFQQGRQNPTVQALPNVDVTRFVPTVTPPTVCRINEETLPCDHTTTFRSFSGWCNNLRNPTFGKGLSIFNRLLPAGYDDGIARPRWRSVTGQPLPSPRLISVLVHQDVSVLHRRYTMITMQLGQFVDHDITLTPVSRGFQDAILNCRDCDAARTVHPECWPIPIPANDPHFPRVNTQTGRPICLPFTRSLPGQQRLGAREQINQNTAFIDASHIYGSTPCDSQRLRTFQGGRMNVTISPFRGKDLLPQTNLQAECKASSGLCMVAGDSRSSEQPGLTTLHTVFLREHNRLALLLQGVNPNWDDERLYLSSRRIVNAVWQHVIYNEYLPRILGWNAINLYGLNLLTEGYFDGYDANCNPGIFNEFAGAAYRFGHSLVRPFYPRVDANFQNRGVIPMRAGFFNSEMLLENQMVDEVLRGMIVTPMENLDQFITNEITNHLFEGRTPFSGLDLASMNIQRGRDHGLRSYNEYRAACNLKRAINFEDLSREMTPEVIARLKQVYAAVDDVDLFTGGLVETALQGGLVGPTFACIIGNQFRSLRRCDRFWYENGNQAGRFTEAQLTEIRKVTFSRLACENSDTIGDVPRSAFDLPHNFLNPRVPCRSLPGMDVNPWRDLDRTCFVLSKSIALGASSLVSPCTSCTCTTDGPQCQSLRVNCQQLVAEVGRDALLADNVCRVQCAFLVNPPRPPQRGRGGRRLPFPNFVNNLFG